MSESEIDFAASKFKNLLRHIEHGSEKIKGFALYPDREHPNDAKKDFSLLISIERWKGPGGPVS